MNTNTSKGFMRSWTAAILDTMAGEWTLVVIHLYSSSFGVKRFVAGLGPDGSGKRLSFRTGSGSIFL